MYVRYIALHWREFEDLTVDYSSNGMDPLVISTEEMRRVIEPLLAEDDWNGRPLARLLEVEIRNFYRKLYKQKWMTYTTAEAWLLKLGLQHLLDNGTLSVVANPRWSQEKWQAYMVERGCEPE